MGEVGQPRQQGSSAVEEEVMSAGDHLNQHQFLAVNELKARAVPGDGVYRADEGQDPWSAHRDWMEKSEGREVGRSADSLKNLGRPQEIHTPITLRRGENGGPDTVVDGHHRIHVAEKFGLKLQVRYE